MQKGKKKSRAMKRVPSSFPPMIKAQVVRPFLVRCQATGAVANNFSYNTLAGYLGVVATAATTSVFIAPCFRLTRVEIWTVQPAAGSVSTVELQWFNTASDFVSPPVNISDSSQSSDHVGHIVAVPPSGSLADKWHTSTQTDNVFSMNLASGGIVDFHFQWVLNDNETTYAGPTLVGATLGLIYHKIANNLTPSYLNSI
jgi:hypothetical protein